MCNILQIHGETSMESSFLKKFVNQVTVTGLELTTT